jgi:S1-C subfamily serine protease
MPTSNTLRTRVSRETRQLLIAALVAIVALWVLARIRFPGQTPSANIPIPSLLSQLSVAPRFANLAGEIGELQARLASAWMAIPVSGTDESIESGPTYLTAMRLENGAAVVLLRTSDRIANEKDILATDRVTGLAVIRAPGTPAVETSQWRPPSLDTPRYLMATVGTPAGVSLRPVLVGSLHESSSAAWPGPIWSIPEGTDLAPSAFVFTTSGEIAGLVVREPAGLAVIPWDIVTAEANRIRDPARTAVADMRIEVRPLTPALARATGANQGVVVAWVDPRGPAGGLVTVGDVIESLNSRLIAHTRDWEVASSRLPAGRATLRIRRRGSALNVNLSLREVMPSAEAESLGLRMRDVPGMGVAVMGVEPRSAGSLARLQEGDIITLAGEITAPTTEEIGEAFQSIRSGEAMMLAITRGRTHLVVGLVK